MERQFILRGMLAGAVSGILAFVFARIFAEPLIQDAIDYEGGRSEAEHVLDKLAGVPVEHEHADPFSRTIQENLGIGIGVILFGVAMGALFAVAYALACGRTGRIGPRPLALLVALGGFLSFYLIPFLKYPTNPPAVGHHETIRDRSGLYLLMVGISLVVLVAGVVLGQRLQPRFGNWNATLLAALACAVVLGIVMLLLPSLGELEANVAAYGRHGSETPLPVTDPSGKIIFPGFPADVLAEFRIYAVATQAILWAGIGLVFAPLAERVLRPKTAQPEAVPA
ncbi:MAG: CbtA family protein [Streptosporangiaceae bacterium]